MGGWVRRSGGALERSGLTIGCQGEALSLASKACDQAAKIDAAIASGVDYPAIKDQLDELDTTSSKSWAAVREGPLTPDAELALTSWDSARLFTGTLFWPLNLTEDGDHHLLRRTLRAERDDARWPLPVRPPDEENSESKKNQPAKIVRDFTLPQSRP